VLGGSPLSIFNADEEGKLKYIKDSNGVKTFAGNTDHSTVRTNFFDEIFTTSTIRILPVTNNENGYFALRMELMTPADLNSDKGNNLPSGAICGFKRSDVDIDSEQCDDYNGDCGIGMADGRITDSQISAINYFSNTYSPRRARLTLVGFGWMPEIGTSNAWIQIELTKAMDISGVMTRGDGHRNWWVTSFKIQYGNSTSVFSTIQDEHGDKVFPGNWDWSSIRTTYFDSIITAKYLRLVVISGSENTGTTSSVLRMEILTPTNLISDEARGLPEGAVCQYESHRFIATSNDHALMVV